MKVERMPNDAGWAVYVEPNELEIRAGQFYPHRALVGFINKRGTLRTSSPVHAPRNWSKLARYKLEDARNELYRRGELRNVEGERFREREEREGSFIVTLSDGRKSRFHSMRREAGFGMHGSRASSGAMEWAEEQLKKPDVRWAEFKREGQAEPFSVLVKNEHGRITYGDIRERRDMRRRRR